MTGLRNSHLTGVANGDTATGFRVSTGPARTSAARDAEYGPRSTLIPDGNYVVKCISAKYMTERRGKKLDVPRLEARWEVYDQAGKKIGAFRNEHSLPCQRSEADVVDNSERFFSIMGRSFAEFEDKLEAYLKGDDVQWSPQWMIGKSGWARIEVNVGSQGGKFVNLRWFMGREEYEAAPGPLEGTPAGGGSEARRESTQDRAHEVAGDDRYADDDIPF